MVSAKALCGWVVAIETEKMRRETYFWILDLVVGVNLTPCFILLPGMP